MFEKLSKLFQGEKSVHPLGSRENLDLVLSEIPLNNPAYALVEVDNLIEDVARYDSELSPTALRQAILYIDEFAHQAYADLLLALVLPSSREHGSELLWSHLDRHNQSLFAAYLHCLEVAARSTDESARDKMPLALCATRAMQAWVERKKLQHFRYRPPDAAWWQAAHQLVAAASQLGVTSLVQAAYPDEKQPRNMLHAYLTGLYLEMVPTSNLIMPQLEMLHRWLQSHASTLEFSETPNAGTTHAFDLANPSIPRRHTPGQGHTPSHRYCSTRRLRSPLLQFARVLQQKEAPPEWLGALMEQPRALAGLAQILLLHWADQPPERASQRKPGQTAMRVVHGFGLARRMIACTAFAKRGKSLRYRGANLENLFNELRFGHANPAPQEVEAEEKVDPMETLLKLETSGDKQMMDEWLKVDASESGLGAVLPALRNRHRIGELVGFRFESELEWRIGIVRRIGRDAQMRVNIGLETLPVPSVCAQVRAVSEQSTAWTHAYEAGTGQADAILLAAESDCLLLPPGLFVENLAVVLNVNGQLRNIVLTEKLDQGNDWERVRFQSAE